MDLNGLTSTEQREMLAKLLQQKAARASRFPMSIGQQGLWHAFRRDPRSTSFNVFLPTRMRSHIDTTAMRQAFEWVAARHDCLHTVFSDAQGELVQIVKSGLLPDFQVIELPGASDIQAREIIAREIERPFDLEQGPLLRVRVVRLATDDCLILAMTHHIVVDFWSLIIILKELREAYPLLARQQLPRLAPAQNNYAQFVAEQRLFLSSSKGDEHRAYWQTVVGQAATVIELPTTGRRPAVFENRAVNRPFEFRSSLVPQINGLAARLKSTPFSVLHSALQVFLSRYSDQKKFFIGSPFSGRSHQQYEQTVGFYINMLPVVADLEGDPTFASLIARTSQQLLEALQHETYPIAQIVHDARLPRDPSRSPLFQVSCTLEKAHVKSEAGRAAFLFPDQHQVWDFGGLRQESFYVPHPTCHYDLEFIFEQTDTQLRGMIVACQALFESETVAAMAENFPSLLQALVSQADVAISRIPWQPNSPSYGRDHSPSSRPTTRAWFPAVSFNSPATNSPATNSPATTVNETAVSPLGTVCGQIESVAQANPQQVALIYEDQKVTFATLLKLANSVAAKVRHQLDFSAAQRTDVSRDIERQTDGLPIVPVCTASGPLAFIAMLGVQLARAIPATIDLSQPAMNATSLGQDTAAQVWLGHPKHAYFGHLKADEIIDLNCLIDSHSFAAAATNAPHATSPLPLSSDVAYLVYTSGSTGKPKGVLVEHQALGNTLAWRREAVPLTSNDRVLMLLSHQFDAALGIAWSAMTQAATLVWPMQDNAADPVAIIEQIIRDQITVLPAIPSLLRILVAHPRFAHCVTLRLIFTGGESMPPELPSLLRRVSHASLWNFYGPTEAAIEATACDVTHHSPLCSMPIGRPINNTEILVLDQYQRPVPDTVPGELAIVGAGLARGYLNAPDLTNSKFVQLAGDTRIGGRLIPAGARMYLTGDRGRRIPDGQIEFLGRTDHQVKLRGYRIELGEIEAILQSHPDVERAAVRVVLPGTPVAQLVATISLRQAPERQAVQPNLLSPHQTNPTQASTNLLTADIKQFAAQHLPHYKVPTDIVVVDHMPLTSSGKVDRAHLPEYLPSTNSSRIFVSPKTALEKFIAAAWCESLHVDSLSINVNYFDAGELFGGGHVD